MSAAAGLLDERSVRDHLVRRGVLGRSEPTRVRRLGGGVSNVVLAVQAGQRQLIVKQALARLRVEGEWFASPERTVTEGRALRWAHATLPDATPAVLDLDEDAGALAIEHAPSGWADWKVVLLTGFVDPRVAAQAGSALGALQAATFGDPEIEREFGSWKGFEELRLRPFHGVVAERHQSLAAAIGALVERMRGRRRCLVHGDCSPKNVLVGPGQAWLIDFEVAHYGDPTFDHGFMGAHLMLKALRRPQDLAALRSCYVAFDDACRAAAGEQRMLDDDPWVVAQTAALMLARVDGRSPAEYLSEEARATARALAATWIERPPQAGMPAAWDELERRVT